MGWCGMEWVEAMGWDGMGLDGAGWIPLSSPSPALADKAAEAAGPAVRTRPSAASDGRKRQRVVGRDAARVERAFARPLT